MRTVEQQVELDQYDALLRQLAASVVAQHKMVMSGAVRLMATFVIGGVDVIVAHDHDTPNTVILLWKGGGQALYDIDADELNAQPPDTPTHWPDTGTVLTNLVADRQGWDF